MNTNQNYVLTGDEKIPVMFNTTALDIANLSRPYKVYTALMSQNGTSNPTVTVLENTLGEIDWVRTGTGEIIGENTN